MAIAVVAVFLATIGIPFIGALIDQGAIATTEQRRAAGFPVLALSAERLAAFPRQFDAYYADHFGWRAQLLHVHSLLKVRLLEVSPTIRVVLGDHRWLFTAEEAEYARAAHPLSMQELRAWQLVLEGRRDWLARHGIGYLVLIAPNKATIYPERLPRRFQQLGPETRLDQLLRDLRRHSSVDVLDIRPMFDAPKRHNLVFLKHDSHWNEIGAYTAYRALAAALVTRGVTTPESAAVPVVRVTQPLIGGDLATMVGLPTGYKETLVRLDIRTPCARSQYLTHFVGGEWPPDWTGPYVSECARGKGRAVFVGDSFLRLTKLYMYLGEGFARSLFLFRERPPLTEATLQAIVDQEHPAVLVEEFVERKLLEPPPEGTVPVDVAPDGRS